jgi:hypothetical protein
MEELIRFDFQDYPFNFSEVWLSAVTILIFGIYINRKIFKSITWVFIVALIKSLIFLIYFVIYFDGTYTSGFDDHYYLSKGVSLINELRDTPFNEINYFDAAEGLHFIYVCISAFAQYTLGEGYYALVAINIIISFFCGRVVFLIIYLQHGNKSVAKLFTTSFIFYPDLIAYSSVFAGKDVLVLLAHLLIIYSFLKVSLGDFRTGYMIGAITLLSTVFLRFYVPIIFLSLIIFRMNKLKLILISIPSIFFLWHLGIINNLIDLFKEGVENIVQNNTKFIYLPYDVLHFWLTPRPFYEDPIVKFTFIANIFNWCIFPVFIYGFYLALRSDDKFVKFLCYYFLVFSIFYGLVDYLNGPRHRLQLIFAIIYFIWIGLGSVKLIPPRLKIKI